jgi:hypothetical protein
MQLCPIYSPHAPCLTCTRGETLLKTLFKLCCWLLVKKERNFYLCYMIKRKKELQKDFSAFLATDFSAFLAHFF